MTVEEMEEETTTFANCKKYSFVMRKNQASNFTTYHFSIPSAKVKTLQQLKFLSLGCFQK